MIVDLHCHTNISDGSFSFDEVLELALKENVTHLAITNHDTTKGLEDMRLAGKRKGLDIIPGIEISAYDFKRNRKIHILGYYIEPDNPSIENLCRPLRESRHQASYQMVQKLIEAGYRISWEQIEEYAKGGTGVYKQHIMHALIANGYADSIYGEEYQTLFSRGKDGEAPGLAFVPTEYVEVSLAIQAIIDAGGVPVLAHPGQYKSFEAVPELVEAGLQGIEVWHPLHDSEEEHKAKQLAEKFDLVMTGGTDFHGFYGEKEVVLGSKNPGVQCMDNLQKRLLDIRKKNQAKQPL